MGLGSIAYSVLLVALRFELVCLVINLAISELLFVRGSPQRLRTHGDRIVVLRVHVDSSIHTSRSFVVCDYILPSMTACLKPLPLETSGMLLVALQSLMP